MYTWTVYLYTISAPVCVYWLIGTLNPFSCFQKLCSFALCSCTPICQVPWLCPTEYGVNTPINYRHNTVDRTTTWWTTHKINVRFALVGLVGLKRLFLYSVFFILLFFFWKLKNMNVPYQPYQSTFICKNISRPYFYNCLFWKAYTFTHSWQKGYRDITFKRKREITGITYLFLNRKNISPNPEYCRR